VLHPPSRLTAVQRVDRELDDLARRLADEPAPPAQPSTRSLPPADVVAECVYELVREQLLFERERAPWLRGSRLI